MIADTIRGFDPEAIVDTIAVTGTDVDAVLPGAARGPDRSALQPGRLPGPERSAFGSDRCRRVADRGLCTAPAARAIAKGEDVMVDDFAGLEGVELTDADPNAGHLTV
ncbi:MAG: hypothetical protein M3088_01315, partial [Actinomycetota bacterium]|nr:hypothetical protein [Actinomycetota bacterium]